MEVFFRSDDLGYLYRTSLNDMKGKRQYPLSIIKRFKMAIQQLIVIDRLEDLKQFRGLNFEYLKGRRSKECAIRLNDQYRLIFKPVNENEVEVLLITQISKHYE